MTVFTIATLELSSKTQSQKAYQPRERAAWEFTHEPPGMRMASDDGVPRLLDKALALTVPRMAEPHSLQDTEGHWPTVEEFLARQGRMFRTGVDAYAAACQAKALLMGAGFLGILGAVLGQDVTVLSPSLPAVWRLQVNWPAASAMPALAAELRVTVRYDGAWLSA